MTKQLNLHILLRLLSLHMAICVYYFHNHLYAVHIRHFKHSVLFTLTVL